jgi:hypothetical protein
MKSPVRILTLFTATLVFIGCNQSNTNPELKILYLHHSTGRIIWEGGKSGGVKTSLPKLFKEYNEENGRLFSVEEMAFPKAQPYGWKNYPFDYYNIWVKNAGDSPYQEEPTLEMLTREYGVIILKHCFPVGSIQPDDEQPDIESEIKTMANYKLQYFALRDKLHEFPDTKFILFAGPALTQGSTSEAEALRARDFFDWVRYEWDLRDDNIYLWDLYELETEGDIYMQEKYAVSPVDPHPNKVFAVQAVQLLFNRILDVIENNGNSTSLTGADIASQ